MPEAGMRVALGERLENFHPLAGENSSSGFPDRLALAARERTPPPACGGLKACASPVGHGFAMPAGARAPRYARGSGKRTPPYGVRSK